MGALGKPGINGVHERSFFVGLVVRMIKGDEISVTSRVVCSIMNKILYEWIVSEVAMTIKRGERCACYH